MSMAGDQDAIRAVTRQGQIIVGALVAGALIFLAIALFLGLGLAAAAPGAGAGQPDPSLPILTYVAVAFGLVIFPMSLLMPALVAKQQRLAIATKSGTAGPGAAPTPGKTPKVTGAQPGGWPSAYQTQLIVGAALIEGAAYFAGIAYLIEKDPIALMVALALIAALVTRLPTIDKVERWIEQQQEKLREEQHQTPFVS